MAFNVAIKWDMFQKGQPRTRVTIPKIDNQITGIYDTRTGRKVAWSAWNMEMQTVKPLSNLPSIQAYGRDELFKLKWLMFDAKERGMITLRSPKGGKRLDKTSGQFCGAGTLKRPWCNIRVCFSSKGGSRWKISEVLGQDQKNRRTAWWFPFHGLRHNFASQLVSNGVGLEVVKELADPQRHDNHKDTLSSARCIEGCSRKRLVAFWLRASHDTGTSGYSHLIMLGYVMFKTIKGCVDFKSIFSMVYFLKKFFILSYRSVMIYMVICFCVCITTRSWVDSTKWKDFYGE